MSMLAEFINVYGLICVGLPCDRSSKKSRERTCCCLIKCTQSFCLLPLVSVLYAILCPCCFTFKGLRAKNGIIRLKLCCRGYDDNEEEMNRKYPEESIFRPYREFPLDADDFCQCCCFTAYNFDVPRISPNSCAPTNHSVLFCRTKQLDELVSALKAEPRESPENL
jgi:hypothetical protein